MTLTTALALQGRVTLAIKQTLAFWEGTMQFGMRLMLLLIGGVPERGLPELRQRPHRKA